MKLMSETNSMRTVSICKCQDTNFAMKAGPRAFLAAEKEGVAIVMPDTSPRGEGVPNVDR